MAVAGAEEAGDNPQVELQVGLIVRPPEPLGQTILAAADRPPASPDAVAAERARAEEGMALLRVVLSGGRSDESAAVGGLDLAPEAWIP